MQAQQAQGDPMSIDDFFHDDAALTPTGMGMDLKGHSPAKPKDRTAATAASTSSIPVKQRKQMPQHFVPQSVPYAAQFVRKSDEFNYLTYHVRKTSIDDSRRVSLIIFWLVIPGCEIHRQGQVPFFLVPSGSTG